MALVILVVIIASVIGWHASTAHATHRAVPGRRRQLHEERRVRLRNGMRLVAVTVLMALVLLLAVVVAGHLPGGTRH